MPRAVRTWSTTVRLTALGASRRIMPHRILELMQEAAAEASTQAGYAPDRYATMGAAWFIKEIEIVIDSPLAYRDPVVVETWISWIRRFRSRREYRIRTADRIVARGYAEWLFLEWKSGTIRPRIPDAAMFEAFPIHDERAIPVEESLPFMEVPKEAVALATDARIIRPTDIDGNDHVNHVRYLAWLDDHGGVVRPGRPIVQAHLEYAADARVGDRVDLALYDTGGADLQFITRADQRLMRASVRRAPG